MVKFTFTVNDEMGLQGEKTGDAKRIFNVMSLSVKANEEVEITVEGEKEEEEAAALEAFVRENI